MAYFFPASFEEQLAYFRQSVGGLEAGGAWAGAYLADLVIAVLAIESAAARERVSAEALAAARGEVIAALAPLGVPLRGYVELVADEAGGATADAWPELCARRSAIELLLTRYARAPAIAELPATIVDRLDASLRLLAAEHGPVAPEWRPAGLPLTHWWWGQR